MAMLLDEQVRLLSMVNVLEPLSREELKDLSQRAPDTHLQEGEDFPNPQQEGERLYVLKKGQAQIYEMTPEGGKPRSLWWRQATYSERWSSPARASQECT
jgi:hypothetical protein